MSGKHSAPSSSAGSWPVVAVGIVAVVLLGAAVGAERMLRDSSSAASAGILGGGEAEPAPGASAGDPFDSHPREGGDEEDQGPVPFARAQGAILSLPAPEPEVVGYHQAYYPDAQILHPLGHLVRNQNSYLFEAPPDADGPKYRILPSRGRGTPATSAVDIVVKRTTDVSSPVTGHVVRARRYRLYGAYRDWRVEIVPEGFPDLRVVMIHLTNVKVRRGDEVSATLTVIGGARKLPFRSQVDDYGGGDPHVHIEVKELPEKGPK